VARVVDAILDASARADRARRLSRQRHDDDRSRVHGAQVLRAAARPGLFSPQKAPNMRYIKSAFDAAGTTEFYRTTCRIDSYREGLIILFTAEQPVFRVAAARKAWAMAAVAAAGKTIRDFGGSLFGVDYVGLTDSEQARGGKVARLPASFAEELQASVHDGKVDAIVAMENLDRQLRLEW
jgi:hypothetical protein